MPNRKLFLTIKIYCQYKQKQGQKQQKIHGHKQILFRLIIQVKGLFVYKILTKISFSCTIISSLTFHFVKHGEVAELAEGTTLLTWQGVKLLAGSNPALSAKTKYNIHGTRYEIVF